MKKPGHQSKKRKLDPELEKEFAGYVEHPRYGRYPRITELNLDSPAFQHWKLKRNRYVPNTAVEANLDRQTPAAMALSHYFDLRKVCCDCKRPFLFFAEEQKHWFEDLGFGLDSDCVRCVPCRKKEQGIARKRERYEELFHVADQTVPQTLEMIDCCLALIESNVFNIRQTERVRMLLKRVPEEQRSSEEFRDLVLRLEAVEKPVKPAKCPPV